MTDALLPCPFCGGRVEIDECAPTLDSLYGRRRWYGVTCRNTENLGGSCAVQIRPSASIEAARTRWNRRAPTLPDGWLAKAESLVERYVSASIRSETGDGGSGGRLDREADAAKAALLAHLRLAEGAK